MNYKNKLAKFWITSILNIMLGIFIFSNTVNAELLNNWKNENAYRPKPVLFLHGFAKGSPETWTGEEGKPRADDIDRILKPYFDKYYIGHIQTTRGILKNTDIPYLEVISFIDEIHTGNTRQELIDRNSSIDTYQAGDYYVSTGEREDGDPGWSDKVDNAVYSILNGYATDKAVLLCHSMGGLAGREYFRAFNGGNNADRLITLATPHLGSHWATAAYEITRTQKIGWFMLD